MSIKCPKCGNELPEESEFCNKCGCKIVKEITSVGTADTKPLKMKEIFKKNKFAVPIFAILLVIIIVIIHLNNPVIAYENDIKNNKLSEASTLYSKKISNNKKDKQKVLDFLNNEVADIKQNFINQKITYNKANNSLLAINQTGLVDNALKTSDYINQLNNSRLSFKKGEEYAKNNDIENALKSYKDVIKDDSNYSLANTKINELTSKYKTQILKNAEESANNKDYKKAVDILTTASQILDKDTDIEAKKAVYFTKLIAKLQSEQQIIVLSSNVISQSNEYKSLYPDMLQVIIKNKSSKTIKDMDVGWLGYDKNNYPIKIKLQFNVGNEDYEFIGQGRDVNVLPNTTFGDKVGWNLDENHGLFKALACVKTVTYYDGTTWDNPYYQYWLEQYKGKPLK